MDIKRKSDEKIWGYLNWLTGYGYKEGTLQEKLWKSSWVDCDMDIKRKSNEKNKRKFNWLTRIWIWRGNITRESMEIFMGKPVTWISRGNLARESKVISIGLQGYVYEEESLQDKLWKYSWDDSWHGYEEEIWREKQRKFQLVNQDMYMKRKRYKRNYGNLHGMTSDMDI